MTPSAHSRNALLFVLGLTALGCERGTPELTQVAVVDGFVAPESAHFDEDSRRWFVSNVGQAGVTGDGFISALDADGHLLDRRLVVGLDDPKGIRVHDGELFVSDVTALVRVPLDAPTQQTRYAAPEAMFLNDVAIDPDNGDVYVSDTVGNAIYRLRDGAVSVLLRSVLLEGPNGLLVEGDSLVIASVGPDLDPATFTASAPGRLFRLDLASLQLRALSDPIGLLDGLERLGSGFLVSDFTFGLYYVSGSEPPIPVLDDAEQGLSSSADIGIARSHRLIAVPDLNGTEVAFYRYSWPRSAPVD